MAAYVYFGGFKQQKLEPPNAFSVWMRQHQPSGQSTVAMNLRIDDESLKSRWRRFKAMYSSLWVPRGRVYILAYSIGCHLAVKFAADPLVVDRVKELWLIAPDPKFSLNTLDKKDSGYDQAQRLWNTEGCPGVELCDKVRKRLKKRIHAVYSEADTVSLWEGNAKIMYERCGRNKKRWRRVRIGKHKKIMGGTVTLDPREARGEFWIHEQLFRNWESPSARRGRFRRTLL